MAPSHAPSSSDQAASGSAPTGLRAVIFDLGGVVLGSPLHAIARYESSHDIEANFVNTVVAQTAPGGAWSRLERGEFDLEAFYPVFESECQRAGHAIDARAMFAAMADEARPRASMLEAIRCIRGRGLRTAALTNNWATEAPESDDFAALREHFDDFIESSVVGLRKPDPRIFQLACDRLQIAPQEAAFLDDIGSNCKAARALGMTTIKVVKPATALAELEAVLGFSLRET